MPEKAKKQFKLWQEIKRRKVHKLLAIYAGSAFIFLEAADIMFPRLGLPDWTVNLVMYLLIIGAIITVILSWIYDITPDGIVKTGSLDSDQWKSVINEKSQKRQKTSNIIITVLFIIVGLLLYPKLFKSTSTPLGGTNQNTIAVLPLKIIGKDSEIKYFANGLVQSLTQMLTKIGNKQNFFSVVPLDLIGETISASNARKQLGVSLIISGSIQQDFEKTRLILNLIDTKKQRLLKSEKLDYYQTSNLMIQDQAISLMIKMLNLDFESKVEESLIAGGSSSYLANKYYLEGLGSLRNAQSANEFDKPIELFKKAVDIDTLFAKAYSGLGHTYLEKYRHTKEIGLFDYALDNTNKALELNLKDVDAIITLANIYYYKGNTEEAFKQLNKAQTIDPSNDLIFLSLADLSEREGDITQAKEYYNKAIELKPNIWTGYFEFGSLYYYQGLFNDAVTLYKRGLQVAPESQNLLNGLAGSYYQLNKVDSAIFIWENLLEIDPDNEAVILNLGTVYYFKGMFVESARMYEKALAITPSVPKYIGFLGEAYYRAGDVEKAKKVFRQLINVALRIVDISNSDYFEIAAAYAQLKIIDSAKYFLTEVNLPKEPDSTRVNIAFRVAQFYLDIGERRQALKWFESALKRNFGWTQIKNSPDFDELEKDPEFNAMLQRLDTVLFSN